MWGVVHNPSRLTSLQVLLGGVVDYAGLFPPAALSMHDALRTYSGALSGPDAWLLGRFVVPASRLPELQQHVGVFDGSRLALSVIVTDGSLAEANALAELRSAGGPVVAECLECKPRSIEGVDWLAGLGEHYDVYVEVDPSGDLPLWFARIAAAGLRAKVRTGGTTAAAFPPAASIVAFMAAAIKAGVPFKATAGLHHAVRGSYRLTYDADATSAVMYGYLNVLLAAAALRAGHSPDVGVALLLEDAADAFVFDGDRIRWRDLEWTADELRGVRADGMTGFGSCSITEPADEIRALAARHSSREA